MSKIEKSGGVRVPLSRELMDWKDSEGSGFFTITHHVKLYSVLPLYWC